MPVRWALCQGEADRIVDRRAAGRDSTGQEGRGFARRERIGMGLTSGIVIPVRTVRARQDRAPAGTVGAAGPCQPGFDVERLTVRTAMSRRTGITRIGGGRFFGRRGFFGGRGGIMDEERVAPANRRSRLRHLSVLCSPARRR